VIKDFYDPRLLLAQFIDGKMSQVPDTKRGVQMLYEWNVPWPEWLTEAMAFGFLHEEMYFSLMDDNELLALRSN
jgi:hypothetical protein